LGRGEWGVQGWESEHYPTRKICRTGRGTEAAKEQDRSEAQASTFPRRLDCILFNAVQCRETKFGGDATSQLLAPWKEQTKKHPTHRNPDRTRNSCKLLLRSTTNHPQRNRTNVRQTTFQGMEGKR
ncbi:unnamed protein product, partial [Ectocarpus sp. 12 AP-2014]